MKIYNYFYLAAVSTLVIATVLAYHRIIPMNYLFLFKIMMFVVFSGSIPTTINDAKKGLVYTPLETRKTHYPVLFPVLVACKLIIFTSLAIASWYMNDATHLF